MSCHRLLLATLTACAALTAAAAPRANPQTTTLSLVDAGSALLTVPAPAPGELSGLTYVGGKQFYAVSDNQGGLHPLTIAVDPKNGAILSIAAAPPVPLLDENGQPDTGRDLEGVAFDAAADEILTVNESAGDPARAISRYRRRDWRKTGIVDLGGTFFTHESIRSGLGLESLAVSGKSVWTANEEALDVDGPRATRSRGTTVRLTRVDAGKLAGQWAYRTEPATGSIPRVADVDGVPDLLALPDGRLLVLERATYAGQSPGDFGGFVSRVYEVTLSGATDISSRPRLDRLEEGADYVAAGKRLLWQRAFPLLSGVHNFEGLSLGPVLDDGSRSVLLIADNDILPSTMWALRLREVQSTK